MCLPFCLQVFQAPQEPTNAAIKVPRHKVFSTACAAQDLQGEQGFHQFQGDDHEGQQGHQASPGSKTSYEKKTWQHWQGFIPQDLTVFSFKYSKGDEKVWGFIMFVKSDPILSLAPNSFRCVPTCGCKSYLKCYKDFQVSPRGTRSQVDSSFTLQQLLLAMTVIESWSKKSSWNPKTRKSGRGIHIYTIIMNTLHIWIPSNYDWWCQRPDIQDRWIGVI